MDQLLLRHRGTPPDAFAHDHDRQQVSWLAGYRLGPPSQGAFKSPVVCMVVGYPPTVAGAAAELPAGADVPHSLGYPLRAPPVQTVASDRDRVNSSIEPQTFARKSKAKSVLA